MRRHTMWKSPLTKLKTLIISGLLLSSFCFAQTLEENTQIELQTDCTLISFDDHGESLTLYVHGRFVQESGPSSIPEEVLNSTDERGISITARNESDQETLNVIRAQIKDGTNQPFRIDIITPVYMSRGGIVFLDLKNSGITIAKELKK